MSETPAYPGREHENADKAARRRALAGLRDIIEDAEGLARRIKNGYEPHGLDAQRLADKAVSIAVNFSVLETLRDVREWHEADKAEATATAPNAWDKLERDVSAATAPYRDAADVLAENRRRSEGQAEATATEART